MTNIYDVVEVKCHRYNNKNIDIIKEYAIVQEWPPIDGYLSITDNISESIKKGLYRFTSNKEAYLTFKNKEDALFIISLMNKNEQLKKTFKDIKSNVIKETEKTLTEEYNLLIDKEINKLMESSNG